MPNTTLPTSGINPGDPNHTGHHQTVHAEINRLSRETALTEVKSQLINGWTATSVLLQRINNRCYLYIQGLNGTAATSSRFMECPAGYQPPLVIETGPQRDISSEMTQGITVSLSGGFTLPTGTRHGSVAREISWPCTADWPS